MVNEIRFKQYNGYLADFGPQRNATKIETPR